MVIFLRSDGVLGRGWISKSQEAGTGYTGDVQHRTGFLARERDFRREALYHLMFDDDAVVVVVVLLYLA